MEAQLNIEAAIIMRLPKHKDEERTQWRLIEYVAIQFAYGGTVHCFL